MNVEKIAGDIEHVILRFAQDLQALARASLARRSFASLRMTSLKIPSFFVNIHHRGGCEDGTIGYNL